jgi:hypothetical protein
MSYLSHPTIEAIQPFEKISLMLLQVPIRHIKGQKEYALVYNQFDWCVFHCQVLHS